MVGWRGRWRRDQWLLYIDRERKVEASRRELVRVICQLATSMLSCLLHTTLRCCRLVIPCLRHTWHITCCCAVILAALPSLRRHAAAVRYAVVAPPSHCHSRSATMSLPLMDATTSESQ